MRTKTKAVLLNALVFPGTGQLLMHRRWRGLLYIAVALACLVLIFSFAWSLASSLVADSAAVDNITINAQMLEAELMRKLGEGNNTSAALAFPVLVLVWVVALFDAILTRINEPAEK